MVTGQHPADLWHGLGDYKILLKSCSSFHFMSEKCVLSREKAVKIKFLFS
jgi:hypothetical protein